RACWTPSARSASHADIRSYDEKPSLLKSTPAYPFTCRSTHEAVDGFIDLLTRGFACVGDAGLVDAARLVERHKRAIAQPADLGRLHKGVVFQLSPRRHGRFSRCEERANLIDHPAVAIEAARSGDSLGTKQRGAVIALPIAQATEDAHPAV